jgi:hypothetical protein
VYARKQALQAGGDLLLAAPERPVLRLLSLIGLIGWLPVFASVEEAASGSLGALAPGWPARDQAVGETSASNVEVLRPQMAHRSPGRDRLPPAMRQQKGGYHNQRQRRVR